MTDPAFFADRFLGIKLHPGQRQWLEKSTGRENALVTGNRWGKSFASAVKLIHTAIYRPRDLKYDLSGRYRTVIGSITQDQANLMFNQVIRLVRQSEILVPLIDGLVRTPFPILAFGNGATVEARTTQNRGEYLLGNDYDLFVFDEVAFEPDPEYVVEEVIMMRLADREGRLDLVSTPNGRNWFYRRAMEIAAGKRRGHFQSGDSRENVHISSDYLDERVHYFSESRLKQNIMGQFVDSGGEVLRSDYIDRALENITGAKEKNSSVRPLYISGWDLARKQTATVGITVSVVDGYASVVELERFRRFDWTVVIQKIKERQNRYPGRLVIDATGLGDVVVDQLSDYNPESVIFTANSKAELLTNVELFHARDAISYNRWELPGGPGRTWSFEEELRDARWDDNNRCDALMALALALWPLRRKSRPPVLPRVARV
ncbi:MAG: hypothetical protein JSU65_08650 [Candidatus Zixiibacteriota bacterium]|nr:MAG: hypothetical protein JSU65_08650 [candidate division Zixibacteria bacterium]